MRYRTVRQHLKPYSLVARRTTTINHAFAAAISPSDVYEEQSVRDAIAQLGQDPDNDLVCAYCGSAAETWDHINATVRNKLFSGFGHRLGNLLPCCKPCNSRKGNKEWRAHLSSLELSDGETVRRKGLIEGYVALRLQRDPTPEELPEYLELLRLKEQVLDLFAQADKVAKQLRVKLSRA
jgi:hypothetical protein